MKMFKILSIALIASVALQSCKKDDDNNDDNGTPGTTMRVRMTDAPGNYAGMKLNITKVEAYLENTGWVTLDDSDQEVSVLTLTNGTERSMGFDATAQAGHYTSLRFTIGAGNTITTNDQSGNATHDLNWVGSSDNTVEVDIDRQLNANSQISVLVDFNVAQSVSQDLLGNYNMTPVITWIEDEKTGVKGDLEGASQGVVTFTGGGNTYTTYMASDGKFMIKGMENGTYNMTFSGMHTGTNTLDEMTMNGVVITNGQVNNLGTIQFVD
jgi:hypothetical protein